MISRKSKKELNLLDLVPERRFDFFTGDDQRIVVRMPRFHISWMQKYLVPKAKDPFIRINLDTFGSHVWLLCDGQKTIGDIADSLVSTFGDDAQPCTIGCGNSFISCEHGDS